MKKIIALICTFALCASITSFAAEDFVKGAENSFFALTFQSSYGNMPDVLTSFGVGEGLFNLDGPSGLARKAIMVTKGMPEGRKCLNLVTFTNVLFSSTDNFIWLKDGGEILAKRTDEFFSAYKKLGGEVDYIYDDNEGTLSVYLFENTAIGHFFQVGETLQESIKKHGDKYEDYIREMLYKVETDPRFETDFRPLLEDAGFVFGPNYDLEYINIFPGAQEPRRTKFYESNPPVGAENSNDVFNSVLGQYVGNAYKKAVYDVIAKYYPKVKLSNYGYSIGTGRNDDIDFNGNVSPASNPLGKPRKYNLPGTHTASINYGEFNNIRTRPPKGYPYEIMEATGFNMLLRDLRKNQDGMIACAEAGCGSMPWVGLRTWVKEPGFRNYLDTDYFYENIFHLGLTNNPDPFLLFDAGSERNSIPDDVALFQGCLHELDEMAGFEDRKSMLPDVTRITAWDQRYCLSGMSAGGRGVWRITPDLYAPGLTMQNFLADEEKMIFRAGNQIIDFPSGSYIYTPEKPMSSFGYWVISPNGKRPVEYRDEKLKPLEAPIAAGIGEKPPGYLTATDEKVVIGPPPVDKPVVVPGDDTTTPTKIVVEKKKPISLAGKNISLTITPLPNDTKGHWAEDAMANIFAMGLMHGTGDGMYPDNPINKVEFLAILERLLGVSSSEYSGTIADVVVEDWYSGIIQAAVDLGWIIPTDTGVNPTKQLTREQMAYLFTTAIDFGEISPKDNISFKDNGDISEWAIDAVKMAAELGIINGYSDGQFKPKGVSTRAEVAIMIERILNR